MAMQMASILSCFIRKWVLVFANVRKIGGLKRSFFVTIGIFANMNEKTIPTIAHKAHPWHGIELGPNCPDELRVFIEIVRTDTVKYEVDKVSGYLSLDRPQKFSNIVPSLYGFIPRSYCGSRMAGLTNEAIARYDVKGDGDPLDICVLTEKDVTHGDIIVKCIPIGGIRLLDHDQADDKIIAVLKDDAVYGHITDIEQLPMEISRRLVHYFTTYKDIPGDSKKRMNFISLYNAKVAKDVIKASLEDYNELMKGKL